MSSIETYFIGFVSPLCSNLLLGLQVVPFLDVFEPVCTFPLNVMCSVVDLFFWCPSAIQLIKNTLADSGFPCDKTEALNATTKETPSSCPLIIVHLKMSS